MKYIGGRRPGRRSVRVIGDALTCSLAVAVAACADDSISGDPTGRDNAVQSGDAAAMADAPRPTAGPTPDPAAVARANTALRRTAWRGGVT